MFIILTPIDTIEDGKECDDVGFNSDLILSIRNHPSGFGVLQLVNGETVFVKQKRKEIVQRINQVK